MAFDLEFGAVVALWLVCLYRLPTLTRSRRQRAFTLMLSALAAAATINEAAVTSAIDRATDVANVSVLLKNLFAILAVMAAVDFTEAITQDENPTARRRRIPVPFVLTAAMLAMIGLFVVIPRREGGPDFVDTQASNPAAGAYGILFQLCLGISLIWMFRSYRRYWHAAGPGPLRTTLLLFNLGQGVGVVYVLNRLVFLISHLAGSHLVQGPVYVAVSTTLFATALLLIAAGSVAYGLRSARRQFGRYLALQRLYPLWHSLGQAVPEVVLGPAPTRRTDLFALTGVRLRLYRRNIEIRDAQWVLRDHVSAATREDLDDAAARLELDKTTADELVEACVLEAGRRARLSGQAPGERSAEHEFSSGDLDDEAQDLVRLGRLVRSPLVARLVDESTGGG